LASGDRVGLKSFLILAGSFAFAFLMGEMIHELGHFLAHRCFGTQTAAIHIDPFGASRIYGVQALPLQQMGLTTAAGPAFNLILGCLTTLLLWRWTSPNLLPFILWGPVALVQEGVNLSLGLLSPGSDARWLVQWGSPAWLLVGLGVMFILLAIGLFSWILAARVIFLGRSFGKRFTLIFFGMAFLMILRAFVALFRSPAAAVENLVPLGFAALLAAIVASLVGWLDQRRQSARLGPDTLPWGNSLFAVGMGLGLLLIQITLP
jgi:hypothetical protein